MRLNNAIINNYHERMVPISILKGKVEINEAYLREKPNWYVINDKYKYFKPRGDLRLFNELFFSELGRDIIGLDTLEYEVANVRTLDSKLKPSEESKKIGLLSTNFQTTDNNYYLVSELYNPEISQLISYGDYSLETLLTFFKDTLCIEDYKNIEKFLTKLLLADSFTLQVDRNPNNIGFQIPKINGVNYKERIRPEALERLGKIKENTVFEDQKIKILGMVPSKVYDNERIFGIDHKNKIVHTKGDVWSPIFPFNNDLLFKSQQEAREMQKNYDGLDPNLFELITTYPEIKPIAERLAYDDEYKKIIEQFKGSTKPVSLSPSEMEMIIDTIEERRKVFQKVLSI